MFHPTIGKCAHESIDNSATPKLGMIPTKNKETLASSYVAKGISKFTQSKQSWVYQAAKELKRMNSKLASSSLELWTPAPDLAWLLKDIHTLHKEASSSLLHNPSGYAFPSSAIQGVQRRKPTP